MAQVSLCKRAMGGRAHFLNQLLIWGTLDLWKKLETLMQQVGDFLHDQKALLLLVRICKGVS